MIYAVGKFFQGLFAPNIIAIVCQCAALWCLSRRRKGARALLIASLAVTLPFSIPAIPRYFLRGLERSYPILPVEKYPTADVILVLGGSVNAAYGLRFEPEELGESEGRLLMATRLWRAHKAPRVLAVGGGRYQNAEGVWRMGSADMKDVLRVMGVPEEVVLEVEGSRSTREDVAFATSFMKKNGWKSALLVTSAFHMPRALETFRDPGIVLTAVPTAVQYGSYQFSWKDLVPDPSTEFESFLFLKEVVGRWVARGLLAAKH